MYNGIPEQEQGGAEMTTNPKPQLLGRYIVADPAICHGKPMFARFREWLQEYEAKAWDRQYERDAKSGKLDQFANQAIADFRAGKYKSYEAFHDTPARFGCCFRGGCRVERRTV